MKVETGCLLSLKKLREREQLKRLCVQRSGFLFLFWRLRGPAATVENAGPGAH